ncbi:MAG: PTS sugar transporter subunit IIA [Erysipelothrix sp.]|nr:PTS sugar transporter subunit IIA [Erysipelothrix sp.]
MLLQEILDNRLYQFVEEDVDSWEEAIRVSCKPLIENDIVDENYPQLLIDSVKEHGPYIVLLPNLAMPHTSQNAVGVKNTAIAFTRFKKPISFVEGDPSKDAQVFFTLAAENETKHMQNMAGLFELLSEGNTLEYVMSAQSVADLQNIVVALNLPHK